MGQHTVRSPRARRPPRAPLAPAQECVKFMANFKFTSEHVQYLRQQPVFAHCKDGFWDWLAQCDCIQHQCNIA